MIHALYICCYHLRIPHHRHNFKQRSLMVVRKRNKQMNQNKFLRSMSVIDLSDLARSKKASLQHHFPTPGPATAFESKLSKMCTALLLMMRKDYFRSNQRLTLQKTFHAASTTCSPTYIPFAFWSFSMNVSWCTNLSTTKC